MRERPFVRPSGATLPFTELGFGGAPLGNLFAPIPEPEAEATLQAAWDRGMRYFDTAPLYGLGLSETRFGRFLADKPRDGFLLSTKVGRLLEPGRADDETRAKFVDAPERTMRYDYSYDGVRRSLEESLERLGLDRTDILFCHDVDVFTHGSREASDRRIAEFMESGYRAFLELREQGVVRAIGAGINEWDVAEKLARAGDFDLFLLAGRYTLLEQAALDSFLPYCVERGIGVVLGGAFNSGVLATGAVEGARYNYEAAPGWVMEKTRALEAVCARHGVALPAAALRFPLAHPAVACVIPGARAAGEVERAVDTFAADIPAALWAELKAEGLLREDAPVPT